MSTSTNNTTSTTTTSTTKQKENGETTNVEKFKAPVDIPPLPTVTIPQSPQQAQTPLEKYWKFGLAILCGSWGLLSVLVRGTVLCCRRRLMPSISGVQ